MNKITPKTVWGVSLIPIGLLISICGLQGIYSAYEVTSLFKSYKNSIREVYESMGMDRYTLDRSGKNSYFNFFDKSVKSYVTHQYIKALTTTAIGVGMSCWGTKLIAESKQESNQT